MSLIQLRDVQNLSLKQLRNFPGSTADSSPDTLSNEATGFEPEPTLERAGSVPDPTPEAIPELSWFYCGDPAVGTAPCVCRTHTGDTLGSRHQPPPPHTLSNEVPPRYSLKTGSEPEATPELSWFYSQVNLTGSEPEPKPAGSEPETTPERSWFYCGDPAVGTDPCVCRPPCVRTVW